MGERATAQRYMTAEQLAEALGVSAQSVNKWRRTRGLPAIHLGGTVYRYDLESVVEWSTRQPRQRSGLRVVK